MSDLFEQVRREIDSAPISPKDLGAVMVRGRTLTLWYRAMVATVCASLILGVVMGAKALDRDTEPIRPSGSGTTTRQDDAPDVARVVCREDETAVETPRVQPQLDGIHIEVENKGDFREFYIRAATDEGQNHGGRLEGQFEEIRTTMPPGEIWFGCFRRSADVPYNERAAEFVTIMIVDPDRLWREPQLACEQESAGRFNAGTASGAAPEDPEGMIRDTVPGVRPDDEVVKPGYPGTEWHGAFRMIVRDEEPIASANVHQQGAEWEITVDRCEGTDVGR